MLQSADYPDMKFLIASDKFKESLSSLQAGRAIQQGILDILPKARIKVYPISDGGEGFCEAVKHYIGTKTISTSVKDPLFRKIKCSYEWDPKKRKAFIELAAASGLALLTPAERDPLETSTWGTGQLIQNALAKGAKEIGRAHV